MSVPYATVRVSRDKEIKMKVCSMCEYRTASEVWLPMEIYKGEIGVCSVCAENFDPEQYVYVQDIAD